MKFTATQIAEILEGDIVGDPNIEVSKLAKIEEGTEGSLTFLSNEKYTSYIYSTQASIAIVNKSFEPTQEITATLIKVEDAYGAFSKLLTFYNEAKQQDVFIEGLKEEDAYPAHPQDGYGWEKLFSERMCRHFMEDYGIQVRIARYHNIYGPYGTYDGGREKAPAAICRKVVKSNEGDTIEVWGDGKQTRSFLYVDECVEGLRRLMKSEVTTPINVGSEEMISINDFTKMIIRISNKNIKIKNIDGPLGVRGRNSDNKLIKKLCLHLM